MSKLDLVHGNRARAVYVGSAAGEEQLSRYGRLFSSVSCRPQLASSCWIIGLAFVKTEHAHVVVPAVQSSIRNPTPSAPRVLRNAC